MGARMHRDVGAIVLLAFLPARARFGPVQFSAPSHSGFTGVDLGLRFGAGAQ